MSADMYDSYSPAPPLGDMAPEYYSESSKAIKAAEQEKKGLEALGGTVGGSITSSQSTLGPKWTSAPIPSGRAQSRKALIDDYYRKQIEPIMANAVTYLLLKNPVDMRGALLTYFMSVQGGSEPDLSSSMISTVGGVDPEAGPKRKALLAKADGMLVKLSKLVVLAKPDDIVGFLVEKIKAWAEFDQDDDNTD
eukprot:CAMPEP_0182505332 /NCGR_PEP_ID=MMETSP1321-20130603/19049_1 /TAXON_ID=91990 /ORGANISM="Bolidomonas sp., Strain RCC1657" /LENGTH=192 /DNA_ID=CAMNT_0024710857 /DNA_START=17 /DNA_END=592 /DNA_ORIENTATION=-